MAKVAFVFPGQASQHVGMGRAVCEASAKAREIFEAADGTLSMHLSRLCFEGPESELVLTANTQPAILTVSAALYAALGLRPHVVAGHSLGEYGAHVAAKTMPFADALRLVRQRGVFMQEAVPVGEGAMAAVLGGEREAIETACRESGAEIANFNGPGQIVISGRAAAVADAGERLKALGARVMPIAVSAPFHSSLMKPAEQRMLPLLRAVPMRDPEMPVVVNVDAVAVTTAAAARDALERQVSRSVRWEESVRYMIRELGVDTFVEVGPGKVLTGLAGRIEKGARRLSVQEPKDFDAVAATLA